MEKWPFNMSHQKIKVDFEYFITMALEGKISWDTLVVFLDDLTPTLEKSKQAMNVLVKELQFVHSKMQAKIDVVEIHDINTSNESLGEKEQSQPEMVQIEDNLMIQSQSYTNLNNDNQALNVNKLSNVQDENVTNVQIDDSEKNASEPEVIHLEDDEEMQNQSILRLNQNSERETNVLKESNAKPSLEVTSEASFDALETFQESNASNLIGNKCKSNDIPSKDTEVLQKRIDQVRQRLDDHLSVQVNGEDFTIELQESESKEADVPSSKDSSASCKICLRSFMNEKSLKSHESSIHKENKNHKSNRCKTCSKTFSSPSSLKVHQRIHSNAKPYKCNICEKAFNQQHTLINHGRTHTDPLTCSTCDKTFTNTISLKKHEKYHNSNIECKSLKESEFECETCNKIFIDEIKFKNHKANHTKEKKFQCQTCDKRFSQSDYFKRHQISHTQENLFKCRVCRKVCTNLNRHMLIHSEEKRFQCDICKKMYRFSYDLTSHKRTHTGDKPFRCSTCGNRYKRVGDLRSHERNMHQKSKK